LLIYDFRRSEVRNLILPLAKILADFEITR